MTFGDDEPEDAWDPDDPIDELVANLIRRAALAGVTVDIEDSAAVLRELARRRITREGFAADLELVARRLGVEL